MSLIATLGAIEIGLVFALVALGVYITFRVLDFPDLTVDGTLPLGAAVAAAMIAGGVNPVLATLAAIVAGCLAGTVTAWLNIRFSILHLLAGILTMTALFSINLRVMGVPNIPLMNRPTVIDFFTWLNPLIAAAGLPARPTLRVLALLIIVTVIAALLARFLKTEFGLAMRATGANPRMARAQGIRTDMYIYVGVALSNGLVALAGALFAQTAGFADVSIGTGTIIAGLAAVILGETIFRTKSIVVAVFSCLIGAIAYRLAIALALNAGWLGLRASDLNLVTAVLVGIALMLPGVANPLRSLFKRSAP
ncbi:ABC transporter permease [Bosea sp. (in: a-proteobacteria)]|jgi:putative ABC transport system permease protein|uniref:ABC transporter permease n=1 Tax=Bosea sp. (in: a-proteobacteria) TaxID=1871050 RepID=UPI002DDD8FBD|nr:ABC transporter permease [Bosea sp. (in: a-proteobacteria)]HEV2509633.1 ABC transporter permease [Bosea sp. (in: a-proteobacteria)]